MDDAGQELTSMRYKACPTGMLTLRVRCREGETCYATGSMNTDYQYTGQRTVGEIGLHFYREASRRGNARWYDSYLNHITQPNTIVLSVYGLSATRKISAGTSISRFSSSMENMPMDLMGRSMTPSVPCRT
jgi:hypothetical protein